MMLDFLILIIQVMALSFSFTDIFYTKRPRVQKVLEIFTIALLTLNTILIIISLILCFDIVLLITLALTIMWLVASCLTLWTTEKRINYMERI